MISAEILTLWSHVGDVKRWLYTGPLRRWMVTSKVDIAFLLLTMNVRNQCRYHVYVPSGRDILNGLYLLNCFNVVKKKTVIRENLDL